MRFFCSMQSRIEQFIQDSARKTVLVGHRQAWSWQDEWCSFSIDDIRKYEAEVQKDLNVTAFESVAKEADEYGESNDRQRSLKADLSLYAGSPKAAKHRTEQSTEEIILGLRMTSIEEASEDSYDTPESDDEYVDALGMYHHFSPLEYRVFWTVRKKQYPTVRYVHNKCYSCNIRLLHYS